MRPRLDHTPRAGQEPRRHLVAELAGLNTLPVSPAHPARVHLTYLDLHHRAAGGRHHDCISIGDRVQLGYEPQVVVISENKDTAVGFPPVPGGKPHRDRNRRRAPV